MPLSHDLKINNFQSYASIQHKEQANTLNLNSTQYTVNAPQPFFAKDGSVSLLRQKPFVRNLVLQGGGAKGICYPIFIETLNKGIPFIKSLRDISGSSVGSIFSFLLASGLSPTDIGKLLDKSNMFNEMSGDFDNEINLGIGLLPASNLIKTLVQQSKNSILAYLEANKHDRNFNAKLEAFATNPSNLNYLNKFKERAAKGFAEGITFKDLEILHFLDPEKFKELHITGYNRQTNETEYYNSKKTPDMFCHFAVRISIAIPVVVKSVIHNGEELSDGGQRDNTPLKVFMDRPDFDPYETFVLVFDRDGKSEKILHARPIPLESPIKLVAKFLIFTIIKIAKFLIKSIRFFFNHSGENARKPKPYSQMKFTKEFDRLLSESTIHGPRPPLFGKIFLGDQYSLDKQKEQDNIYKMSTHVFSIPTKGIGTVSFNANQNTIAKAKKIAELKAHEYIEIHKNTGDYRTYVSQEQAIKSLKPKEIDAIMNMDINPMASNEERHFYESVQNRRISNHVYA